MTDRTAFENLIAEDVRDDVGPEESVDARAITRKARAASTRWTFPSRPSALEFAVAGVMVVLFGGLLLAGVLTTRQDGEVAPAALTESPSPMTSEEVLSGMVTEEVEPGVLRVIGDGYRDLTPEGPIGPSFSVDITPDGNVWLRGEGARPGLFRLGDGATFDDPGDPSESGASIELASDQVAPDGSFWAIGRFLDDRTAIFSFDGRTWTERTEPTGDDPHLDPLLGALAIGSDGTVWVTATNEHKDCPDVEHGACPGTDLMRLEDDGSFTTIVDWADLHHGDAHPYPLKVSPDGGVWVRGLGRSGRSDSGALLRFDGSEWEVLPLPEGFANRSTFLPFDFGPDGTPWVQVRGLVAGQRDARGLARFDDSGWTVFPESDDGLGWQGWSSSGGPVWFGEDLLTVAADGSVWHPGRPTEEHPCGGMTRFDGISWTTYLEGVCISDLAVAPDGSIWLRGNDGSLYVITPEAATAAEP